MLDLGIVAARLGYERQREDIEAILLYTRALSAGGQHELALELLRKETLSRPKEPRIRAEASRTLYQLERSRESVEDAKIGRELGLLEAKAIHDRCRSEGGNTEERASQCREGAYERAVHMGKTGERIEAYGYAFIAVSGEPQASNRTYTDIWDLAQVSPRRSILTSDHDPFHTEELSLTPLLFLILSQKSSKMMVIIRAPSDVFGESLPQVASQAMNMHT